MNARLGFSIAAHLNPEALIIDEVLSVGDMVFQARCVERMRAFKRDGVTIVFVSHNLQAVTELCDDALFLQGGVRALGKAADVVDKYVRQAFTPAVDLEGRDVVIRSIELLHRGGGTVAGPVEPGAPLTLRMDLEAANPVLDLNLAVRVLRSTDQLLVYDGHFPDHELALVLREPGRATISFDLEANLTRGQYYFDVIVQHTPTQKFLARMTPAAHLAIAENRTWGGVADLNVKAVKSLLPVAHR
jgi:energy-coupling factor transporter ATP-binding protein EcfA2